METTQLDAVLARIPDLGQEEVRVLHATWEGGDVKLRRRAWQRGKRILEQRGLEDLYREATDLVRRWTNDHTLATRSTVIAFGMVPSYIQQDWLDLRIAAAPPLLDVILAALVGDELEDEEREELEAPWLEAMGRPMPIGDDWADTLPS